MRETVFDTAVTDSEKNARLYETRYEYDKLNQVKKALVTAGGRSLTTGYSYNDNRQPKILTMSGASRNYSYDSLGRLTGKSLSTTAAVAQDYIYYSSDRNAEGENTYRTTQIARELMGNLGYYYEYDVMGNLTRIRSGVRTSGTTSINNDRTDATYVYDSKGQLVRENNYVSGKTIAYKYDTGGNILNKKIYPYTTASSLESLTPEDTITYTYDSGWKDQLLSYDGETISYDGIGNPLNYRGSSLEWQGRELKSLSKDGTAISYIYGTDGLRTKKTAGNEVHEYYYSGGQLVYEKRGSKEFYYTYDFDGSLSRISYYSGSGDPAVYYPVTNVRGDVQALFDSSGNLSVEYTYDAWGNTIEIRDGSGADITDQNNIGHQNRIRYRGYYYDAETGFYYVSSRYYDPEVGRFISADGYISTGTGILGFNMFAYCNNNPVNFADPTGTCITNARGDTIHYNCGYEYRYNPRLMNTTLASVSDAKYLVEESINLAIRVTRYSYNSAKKPRNWGSGTFEKNKAAALNNLDNISLKVDKLFDAADIAIMLAETSNNCCVNIMNNSSGWKIAWDITVDVTILSANIYMATAIGNAVVPVAGAAVGFAVGVVTDVILTYVGDGARKDLKSWVK